MPADLVLKVHAMHKASLENQAQSGDEFTDNFYLFALRLKRATDARAGGDTSVPTVNPSVARAILHSMSKSFAATAPPPPPPPPAPRAGDEPVAPTSSLHSLMGAPRAPIGKVTVEPAKQLTLEEKTEIMDSRTRSWEQAHQVLGHNSRSNLRRPKENLELPTATHVLGGAGAGAGEGVVRDESSAQLWRARAAVDRAATCAIRVDDCNRAQLAAAQSWRPVAPDAVRSLETNQRELGALLGVSPAPNVVSKALMEGTATAEPLSLLLSIPKGKRLLVRCVGKLSQGAIADACVAGLRLLPHFVASTTSDPEAESVDQELANSLASWISNAVAAAGLPMEVVGITAAAVSTRLGLLVAFLDEILKSHDSDVLRALLYHPGGATVFGALLTRGEEECGLARTHSCAEDALAKWHALSEELGRRML